MKAVYLESPHNVYIKEVPFPDRKENEVLIKVKASSICGSDISAFKGTNLTGVFPRILGHEIAGEVVEVPEKNSKLHVGDRVVVEPYKYCGTCYPCSTGKTNSCLHLSVIGVFENGGMSEYFSHPLELVHKAPDNIPWENLSLAEPLTIALHAIHRANLKSKEHVVISGAGTIGILTALAVNAYGAVPIIIDIIAERLNVANNLGIINTINSSIDDPVEKIKEFTDGRLAEVVIEMSGAESAIRNTIDYVIHTGRIVFVGWPKENQILFPTTLITKKELDIRGAKNSAMEFPEAIKLIAENIINVSSIISKTVSLTDTPKAIIDLTEHPNKYLKITTLL